MLREKLKALVPKADNVVLLFTGNGKLTTSASSLKGDAAPNSLAQDAIKKGKATTCYFFHPTLNVVRVQESWGYFLARVLTSKPSGSSVLAWSLHLFAAVSLG